MRELNTHHDGHGLNEAIELLADEPGPGGASHNYIANIRVADNLYSTNHRSLSIQFQRGPRHDPQSTPGVTEAVLAAILLDRLEAFQNGDYPDGNNARAIEHIKAALQCMKQRANERAARNVLGTMAK